MAGCAAGESETFSSSGSSTELLSNVGADLDESIVTGGQVAGL